MSDYLQNTEEAVRQLEPRFKLLYIVIAVSGLVLFSRLWYLQIIQGKELRTYSEKNRVKETRIPAQRGFILDRNNQILVQNLPSYSVTISPQYATKLESTSKLVSEAIGIPGEDIYKMVKKSRRQNGPFLPAVIKRNLTLDEVYDLKLLRFNNPGLNIVQNNLRKYMLGNNGAQMFGYVGEIAKSQIERYRKKYRGFDFEPGDIVGKGGLELTFESDLRGQPGLSFVEVDARGRETIRTGSNYWGLKSQPVDPGLNMVLTIDKDVQEAAYNAMKREDKIGSRNGSLVAIKNNGEILAWVSSPAYDPNEFSTGISQKLWNRLVNDPFKPMRNKVIQDHYAPGSTFKPVVALAALQEKIITANTVIFSPGSMRFGRRTYHDHSRSGHGNITILQALERSSNIFFYKMGIELGIDRIYPYANALGIGQRTKISMANEARGLMPNKEWKLKRYGEEWQPGENLSNAIGQGFVLTTALQMALAYNAIGLEGELYKPLLVKEMIDADNKIIKRFEPEIVRDLSAPNDTDVVIDKKNFRIVREGMRRVANGDGGTARWWKIPGVQIAGKTGTSQVRSFSSAEIYARCDQRRIKDRHHGWFVGFAPAEKPLITVAVLAEHACAGSSGGAPVVRDVIEAYIKKYYPELIQKKGLAGKGKTKKVGAL